MAATVLAEGKVAKSSRIASDSIRFTRPFSSSSAFSRFAVAAPASCSSRIPMISPSANRDRFIGPSLSSGGLSSAMEDRRRLALHDRSLTPASTAINMWQNDLCVS